MFVSTAYLQFDLCALHSTSYRILSRNIPRGSQWIPPFLGPRSLCGSTSAFKSRLLDQLPISTPPSPLHPLRSYGSRRLSSRDPQRRFSTNRETFKKIEKCKSSESKQFESRTKKSWVTGNDLVSNPRKQRFTKP